MRPGGTYGVLRHEYVHIRRFDNLWKILVFTAVCIHWFNPMAFKEYQELG
ncbi:M56 family metallopeptidase [Enterocloster clostridioformis]|nr:M56 family metallopeptidase [Enterocloster clostridioformis]